MGATPGYYAEKIDLFKLGLQNNSFIDSTTAVSGNAPYAWLVRLFDGTCRITGAFKASQNVGANNEFFQLSSIVPNNTYFSANVNMTLGEAAGLGQDQLYSLVYSSNDGGVKYSNVAGGLIINLGVDILINGILMPINYKDQPIHIWSGGNG